MNSIKKRLLFSSLILISLVVLSFYVMGDLLGTTSVVTFGEKIISNDTSFGTEPKTVNVSIGYGDLGGITNITMFNLTIGPSGNHSFDFTDSVGSIVYGNDSEALLNVTYWTGSGLTDAAWQCHNDSVVTISCNASSEAVAIDNVNTSLVVNFNLTGAADIEDTFVWNLLVWNGTLVDGPNSAANGTNFTVFVDTLAPRLLGINISDGNMTLGNASHANLSDWEYAYLRGNMLSLTDLTVELGVEESDIHEIWLYYQTNDSVNATIDGVKGGNYTYKTKMDDNGHNLYTATIKVGNLTDANISTFLIVLNDSNGNEAFLNNTDYGVTIPFSFLVNSSDVIQVGYVEVNDSYNSSHTLSGATLTGSDGTDNYLREGNVVIAAEVYGQGKVSDSVCLVWNNSGEPEYAGALGQFVDGSGEYHIMTNVSGANESAAGAAATFTYAIPLGGNDSNNFTFYIVANNTNNTYTAVAGPYNFLIDGNTPSSPAITLTSPSGATSIETSGSATYSCSSTDAQVGGVTYTWKLTKPDGTFDDTDTGSSVTYSGSDVNQAGSYTIECTATDALGYNIGDSVSLSVVYAGGGGGTGGGGGGGTGTPTYDVDLSTQDSGTIKAKQGYVKTFTFDGVTKHTISFKTVETDKVVLKITSTPVEITLGIKESREVDINGDGINDLRVTLEEIRGGKADVTIKKLEAGAEIVAREDRAAAGIEEDIGVEEVEEELIPEEGMGLGSIVMIIAILLIIVGVGYYFMKKK